MEISHCNAESFQLFLDEFSMENPEELKCLVLDNAAFHKAKKLKIPKNVVLIFQPPYSPEVNAAESMWKWFKRNYTNKIFRTMDQLRKYLYTTTKKIKKSHVKQTCSYDYVFSCNIWTNL